MCEKACADGAAATAEALARRPADPLDEALRALGEARRERDEARAKLAALDEAIGELSVSPCDGRDGTVYHYEVTTESWEAFLAALPVKP
jgi:hypothetical protein